MFAEQRQLVVQGYLPTCHGRSLPPSRPGRLPGGIRVYRHQPSHPSLAVVWGHALQPDFALWVRLDGASANVAKPSRFRPHHHRRRTQRPSCSPRRQRAPYLSSGDTASAAATAACPSPAALSRSTSRRQRTRIGRRQRSRRWEGGKATCRQASGWRTSSWPASASGNATTTGGSRSRTSSPAVRPDAATAEVCRP